MTIQFTNFRSSLSGGFYILFPPCILFHRHRWFSPFHQLCSEKNNLALLLVIKPDGLGLGPTLGIPTSCIGQNLCPLQESNWFLRPHFLFLQLFSSPDLSERRHLCEVHLSVNFKWMISSTLFTQPHLWRPGFNACRIQCSQWESASDPGMQTGCIVGY